VHSRTKAHWATDYLRSRLGGAREPCILRQVNLHIAAVCRIRRLRRIVLDGPVQCRVSGHAAVLAASSFVRMKWLGHRVGVHNSLIHKAEWSLGARAAVPPRCESRVMVTKAWITRSLCHRCMLMIFRYTSHDSDSLWRAKPICDDYILDHLPTGADGLYDAAPALR